MRSLTDVPTAELERSERDRKLLAGPRFEGHAGG